MNIYIYVHVVSFNHLFAYVVVVMVTKQGMASCSVMGVWQPCISLYVKSACFLEMSKSVKNICNLFWSSCKVSYWNDTDDALGQCVCVCVCVCACIIQNTHFLDNISTGEPLYRRKPTVVSCNISLYHFY